MADEKEYTVRVKQIDWTSFVTLPHLKILSWPLKLTQMPPSSLTSGQMKHMLIHLPIPSISKIEIMSIQFALPQVLL